MRLYEIVARVAFGLTGLFLMLLALGLLSLGAFQLLQTDWPPTERTGSVLLETVGYAIIAVAVFDVGKYLIDEEAIRGREMRQAGEARQSMTKFLTTIAIAIFLEALVAVFEAAKSDLAMMIYPIFLLLSGVALIVGLGVFQRLSATVEKSSAESPRTVNDEVPLRDR